MDRSGALVRANVGLTRVREAGVSLLSFDRSGVVEMDGHFGWSHVSQVGVMGNRMVGWSLCRLLKRLAASFVVGEVWGSRVRRSCFERDEASGCVT